MNEAEIHYASNLLPQTLHALVGWNASFSGSGQVAYDFHGEETQFVGIQMVPDQEAPPPPHRMVFAAHNVQLTTEMDRDLWKTILPFNILDAGSYPAVTFKPSESSMQIRVSATLDPEGPELVSKTMSQQDDTWTLDAVPFGNDAFFFKNKTLYFVVEPVAGKLGNGIYTLEMKVNTTDPNPYLAYEQAFLFPNTNPDCASTEPDCLPTNVPNEPFFVSTLPPEYTNIDSPAIVDIVQDPSGYGSAIGTFDSDVALSPGAIDVYRFWVATPGPITIRTVGLPNAEGDVMVNTNFNLYREYVAPNSDLYLRDFDSAVSPGLGDWFPADRTLVDDQTYINYFDPIVYSQASPSSGNNFYLTEGGAYYVVVKNEQGTVGDYKIEVDTAAFPLLGDAFRYDLARKGEVVQLPWNNGANTQALFRFPYIDGVERFVGYIPLQLPEFHDGTLHLLGQPGAEWDLHLYDESSMELPRSVVQTSPTTVTFTIPQGNQRVFLRVREVGDIVTSLATLTASIGLVPPFGIAAPPSTVPALPAPKTLPTTPAGDTADSAGILQPYSDSITGNQTKQYGFQSHGEHLTVRVAPERDALGVADVELVWGVYVNGQLMTWNHTLNLSPDGESEAQIFLPDVRPPLDPTDYDYDRGPYDDVVVQVKTISSPQNGGDFSVTVDSSSDLPMRNRDLILPPLALFSNVTAMLDGNDWTRFFVPHGASGLALDVDLQNGIDPGGLKFFAEIYDNDGRLVFTDTVVSDPINTGATFSLDGLADGQGYFLRTGYRDQVFEPVLVELSAALLKNLPGNGFTEPPSAPIELSNFSRLVTNPQGDAFVTSAGSSEYRHVFWVGESGSAKFTVDLGTNNDNHYVALYRVNNHCTELCSYNGYLVDFANGASLANGQYELETFVEPGAYLLRTVQFATSNSADIQVRLPAFLTETLVLEPNEGLNSAESMHGVAQARDGFGRTTTLREFNTAFGEEIPEGLRTGLFRVVAPSGALGDVDAHLLDLAGIPLGSTRGSLFAECSCLPDPFTRVSFAADPIGPPTGNCHVVRCQADGSELDGHLSAGVGSASECASLTDRCLL